jgi:uncharacterized membrane protein YdbT with pleckstrin-like domain
MLHKHNLLSKNEKIIFLIRHHWLIPFKIAIFYLFLALIPFLGYYLINRFIPEFLNQLSSDIANLISILSLSAYYLLVLLFFFHSWLDYYLDLWIITNERVIDIEQKGFFSRIVAEHKLSRIQDVSSEVRGILPTLFHYGNVKIQTAGEEQLFIFEKVPHPQELSRKIHELVENAVKEENRS